MGDPKPVYKNGVLIGYTYDGTTMTPVQKGAKEVYNGDKFIGITYDGKTMTPFEPEEVKKKNLQRLVQNFPQLVAKPHLSIPGLFQKPFQEANYRQHRRLMMA